MIKTITLFVLFFFSASIVAQQYKYVNADNGLIVREFPDKNAVRNGKLAYGSKVRVVQETNIELTVIDGTERFAGKWIEIREVDGELNGFVFSAYLSSTELKKRVLIEFGDITLEMELDIWDELGTPKKVYRDSAKVFVELGDTPEGKKVKIKQSTYRKIEIFQQYKTSVTIMNEGPHCDLTDWKHYYSEWEMLAYDAVENTFLSKTYAPTDGEKFIAVDINELKKAVEVHCGGYWPTVIEKNKSLNDYPIGVSISRVFFKISLTDKNGLVQEKIISFEIPMGC